MKNLFLSFMSLAILAIMFSCSTGTENTAGQEGNAIPYPNAEWKGVQGKTLADSTPDFIGQPQAPEGLPMCWSSCWMMPVIPMQLILRRGDENTHIRPDRG
jgi:hypothetical protein